MKKINIFLDSSVMLAGLASTTGASAEILRLAEILVVKITICNLVFEEVERNIKNKLPSLLPLFYTAIDVLNPKTMQDEIKLNKKFVHLFPKESDQIIIQTALKSKSDYVITLDKKHLLQPEVIKEFSMSIVSPSDFLKKFRQGF